MFTICHFPGITTDLLASNASYDQQRHTQQFMQDESLQKFLYFIWFKYQSLTYSYSVLSHTVNNIHTWSLSDCSMLGTSGNASYRDDTYVMRDFSSGSATSTSTYNTSNIISIIIIVVIVVVVVVAVIIHHSTAYRLTTVFGSGALQCDIASAWSWYILKPDLVHVQHIV